MLNESVVTYVKKHFPYEPTSQVATALNLTISQVRSIAKKNNINKSQWYLEKLKTELIQHRRNWYELNLPDFSPTIFQEQIIFGSMLGDGYISKGADRSVNYHYQEHFSEKQMEYRQWKLKYLKELGFSINGNYLRSKSHPFFTHLHTRLYDGNQKVINSEFLSNCTHPIFLTVLYLDDGTLTLSYKYNKNSNTVYCHPSIVLSTLNFTCQENQLLANYLNQTFGLYFIVSGHPDGKKSLLKINKEQEVRHFLSIISPFTGKLSSMEYKTNIDKKLKSLEGKIKKRYGNDVKIFISSSNRMKNYSQQEIETLILLKKSGYTDQMISQELGRSYWSIVYKIKELRKNDLLKRY